MVRDMMAVFLLLVVVGCETVADRARRTDAALPEERVEAVGAIGEVLQAEEEDLEAGERPSPEAAELLRTAAAMADFESGDPDAHVRAACLKVLGGSALWRESAVFCRALKDPALRCRWEALRALRRKQDPAVIPDVIALLKRSSDLLERQESIHLLRELKAEEAIPVLIGIVTDLLERNKAGTAAWLALRELTGQDFSSDNFLAWDTWYRAYRAEKGEEPSQESESPVESAPAAGKGAGGGEPPEKR